MSAWELLSSVEQTKIRDLYFKYDGFRFHMFRDGLEETYLAAEVPAVLQVEWLETLTAQKLATLDAPGNWWSINFLVGHSDTRHFRQVVPTAPQGVLWERCAYLEHLLRYIDMCKAEYGAAEIAQARVRVHEQAIALLPSCRSEKSRKRVQQIVNAASHLTEGR